MPGLRHLCFDVDDAVERLRGHGGELVREIVAFGGVYRLGYLRGPAGVEAGFTFLEAGLAALGAGAERA